MHLEADAYATLEDLDAFLRSTWLECCGHMSAFTINKKRYITGSGLDAMWVNVGIVEGGESDMNIGLSNGYLQEMSHQKYSVMYVGNLLPKSAHNALIKARDGFAISVLANISAVKIFFCQLLTRQGLEFVVTQGRNQEMIYFKRSSFTFCFGFPQTSQTPHLPETGGKIN